MPCLISSPQLGVGAGSFECSFPRYAGPESLEMKESMERRTHGPLMARHAHNEYLEILAETGIPGLGIFCFLLYRIATALGSLLKRYVRGQGDILTVGLAAAFVSSLAHAFFSANLQNPASAIMMGFCGLGCYDYCLMAS